MKWVVGAVMLICLVGLTEAKEIQLTGPTAVRQKPRKPDYQTIAKNVVTTLHLPIPERFFQVLPDYNGRKRSVNFYNLMIDTALTLLADEKGSAPHLPPGVSFDIDVDRDRLYFEVEVKWGRVPPHNASPQP